MKQLYIGTSGWHYDNWRGIFYPKEIPKKKWLEYYSGKFNTVEINNTFYRQPSEAAVDNWRRSCPQDFIFSVKANRFITHIKRLKNCGDSVNSFIANASLLGEKLGPLLYQLHPGIKRDDGLLESFLSGLTAGFRHVIEFRHISWLTDNVYDIMHKYKAGLCVFDLPEFTCPVTVTAGFAYIRFHGKPILYTSSYSLNELSDWAEKISAVAEGLDAIYIYFNNDALEFGIQNASTLRDLLAQHGIK